MIVLLLFFLAAAGLGFAGLCRVCPRQVLAITGTAALIVALAVIPAAIPH